MSAPEIVSQTRLIGFLCLGAILAVLVLALILGAPVVVPLITVGTIAFGYLLGS